MHDRLISRRIGGGGGVSGGGGGGGGKVEGGGGGFLSENFQFLVMKFSIHLNRRVFVMSIVHILSPVISDLFSVATKCYS